MTHHKNPFLSADHVWNTCQRDPRYLARGADYLLYHILDTLAADFMPVVDKMDDAIDRLEDDVFASTDRTVLNRIFSIKRAVLHLRRIIIPQREVMNRLARDTYAVVDPRSEFISAMSTIILCVCQTSTTHCAISLAARSTPISR